MTGAGAGAGGGAGRGPVAGANPRARYRARMRAEIKQHAWEQIAEAGASALSLNAIARRMGMSGPALYRYFAGRDELITELIRDGYRSLADTFHAAAAGGVPPQEAAPPSASGAAGEPGTAGAGRASGASGASEADGGPETPRADRQPAAADLGLLAHALRGWALADPHRYLLVYGTPVPGYHAPDDITDLATGIMAVLLDACAAPGLPASAVPAAPFAAHVAEHRDWARGHPAPPAALHRALTFWTRVHGVLSLEVAGHFTGMGFDPARLFAAEVHDLLTPR
jgi:AcrR family transcriptional regulator